ncbi:hypothetical protein C2I18_27940 [Paenibacillus sp. PK3_47]|uniref:TerB N-terminal domain-containing protein n=1 Tax=Paenibacillus sp. PK3_47 TaxID=2072642 RepID=UPI00201D301D|nr:TerB N-terminal domain-containing protein [Paenibacillus sp. PK3_47]UQZ37030.1 hypothetical protein C2I18_27940 [Paenibacillus sp. PK3_47]
MKDKRNQPHFTELVWDSTERNVPVPPRDSAVPAQPAEPGFKKKDAAVPDAVQLKLWDLEVKPEPVTTTESQFVHRARELVDHKENPALFVPFKSYWPTYGHMTGEQSRWYFFWRDEVRQGRYPKTDLSYIFLHTYELINGVGWKEPEEGCRQLCLLWEAYRDAFKRLDQYMGGWIADFSFVHKLQIPLSGIVARSRGLAGDLAELELMRCLTAAPEQLSFEVLTVMSDYDISKSKFYTGEGKSALERYIPQVVALIDAYVARKHGSKLVDMFPPGSPVLRERYLFRSAVYDISLYGYSVLVPVVRISKSLPLRSLVTRLFRLTENKLRELMGFRGRLKDIKVEKEMEDLITRFLHREFRKAEQAEKGPAVVIDPKRLEQLVSDSEVVRTLLTVENGGEDYADEVDLYEHDKSAQSREPQEIADKTADRGIAADGQAAVTGAKYSVPEPPVAAGNTENKIWEQFADALSPLQLQVLLTLTEDGGEAAARKLAAAGGTMAELLYDEINELAMDMLGDLLIEGEAVTGEFMPMLQYLKR